MYSTFSSASRRREKRGKCRFEIVKKFLVELHLFYLRLVCTKLHVSSPKQNVQFAWRNAAITGIQSNVDTVLHSAALVSIALRNVGLSNTRLSGEGGRLTTSPNPAAVNAVRDSTYSTTQATSRQPRKKKERSVHGRTQKVRTRFSSRLTLMYK